MASKALQAAMDKATELEVPLVVAGDLHDNKAIIRAEVANRLLEIFKGYVGQSFILVGNHDLINEKSTEHGLNYLRPYSTIIDEPTFDYTHKLFMIPYQNDSQKLMSFVKGVRSGTILIMHQGFKGAYLGDYIQDKTSIDPILVKDFRIISGHYHKHQSISTVTYIGNPYTLTFGEANDGPKGFLILNSDGTFTREILKLRKHVIKEFSSVDDLSGHICAFGELFCNENDLLWIKVKDKKENLTFDKKDLVSFLCVKDFKLDLIPTDAPIQPVQIEKKTDSEILDALIDQLEDKDYLKKLWKDVYEAKKS